MNAIFHNACVRFDYKNASVNFLYADLMYVSLNLETDISDPYVHQKIGLNFLPDNTSDLRFVAPAAFLNKLLIEANAPSLIDLLVLDVEGAEIEVLESIDHRMFKFKSMCIESRNAQKLFGYLNSLGYILKKKSNEQDYLYSALK